MSLKLLLDENISPIVADQVRLKRPEIDILSIRSWQDGAYVGRADRALLLAARNDESTLVTYDLKTIPELLAEMFTQGQFHAGVVFVDNLTITGNDFGLFTRALIAFWDRYHALDWRDMVLFLDKPRNSDV